MGARSSHRSSDQDFVQLHKAFDAYVASLRGDDTAAFDKARDALFTYVCRVQQQGSLEPCRRIVLAGNVFVTRNRPDVNAATRESAEAPETHIITGSDTRMQTIINGGVRADETEATAGTSGVASATEASTAPPTTQQRLERAQKQLRVQESVTVAQQMDLSPSWVEVDAKKFAGVFEAVPDRAELPADINEALIVELYSK